MVDAGLNGVNRALLRTETDAQRLAVGDVQNLHQVMIHMEEAKAGFQLLLQVRNRLLDAYQEVMRMQI
ncbi:Flagellar hook-basal body complex protein FliE [compost metagenome]